MSQTAEQTSTSTQLKPIESLNWDNSTLRSLFVEKPKNPRLQSTVRNANFSMVEPEPLANPRVVAVSEDALKLLDLDPEEAKRRPDFAEYFSGNKSIPGTQPAAHCYCGHQFGNFAGQLGDGAAMYLGEVLNSRGERWELQFKGAGLTPYSRAADGRKVLRSSLREFLCSEAIHALGIPTTRAGTCVTSETKIIRDPLYDGNAIAEPATVITRIAQTFLRFGSFEIFKPTDAMTGRAGSSPGLEAEMLPTMLHFTIKNYFPEIWAEHNGDQLQSSHPQGNEPEWHKLYGAWYPLHACLKMRSYLLCMQVVRRTASMVAGWQSVGWCHGVLNTDNMSIVGLTIDYGPFGFMDAYNPDHICNGSDDSGRYSYKNQPEMCRWNCVKLAEAIKWALPEKVAREELPVFDTEYDRVYMRLMRNKLGLLAVKEDSDDKLIEDVLKVMAKTGADFTNTFRCLSRFPTPSTASTEGEELTYADGGVLQYILGQCADVGHLVNMSSPTMPPQNLQMMQMLMQKDPSLLLMLGLSPQMLNSELEKARNAERLKSVTPEAKAASDCRAWLSSF
ncbi:hypothetical protein DUNSADRAFT_16406 [Dunaliella salina]|uniref:Selenoprotein O n=1 Tax=Dunaliella salina TaxID=3046 RepID=A0ABQ7G3L9_DUNSA|nr:hypothetical protein DUNSADRAFT_16406 [Dunaliella salina]|eukprot:KAF5829214.1 hypothetical protein DUNSADRAFT_16406 [Dunaliella salina]